MPRPPINAGSGALGAILAANEALNKSAKDIGMHTANALLGYNNYLAFKEQEAQKQRTNNREDMQDDMNKRTLELNEKNSQAQRAQTYAQANRINQDTKNEQEDRKWLKNARMQEENERKARQKAQNQSSAVSGKALASSPLPLG
ncbi:hypothetical protein CQA49_00055 [Helicobacter sp. MIT 00-7814]|uniref:hypothetical protein n=1 Tax=unclassified Helicobacter TaxID=2593540 RepID=UPI000E1F57AC|nr:MULTISPECIES: hypothetical protein [unclassified Helicobacter]RDU57097.1 hypothetical protein CQA49_00055 [Helicobacter sp. MIT 00-7814]RDU57648.1 hypothetical protein CQA37_00055 [Helicobacter sp. MIT 99-10781]